VDTALPGQPPREEQTGRDDPPPIPHLAAIAHAEHQGGNGQRSKRGSNRRQQRVPQPPRPDHRRRPSRADGRKIGRQLIELIQRAGRQRTPGPFIEFLTGQPARLEMLTQRRYHRIAVGIGGLHLREPVPLLRRVHRYLPIFRPAQWHQSSAVRLPDTNLLPADPKRDHLMS
jgi:hypothetical protein